MLSIAGRIAAQSKLLAAGTVNFTRPFTARSVRSEVCSIDTWKKLHVAVIRQHFAYSGVKMTSVWTYLTKRQLWLTSPLLVILICGLSFAAIHIFYGGKVPYEDLMVYNKRTKELSSGDRAHDMKLESLKKHCNWNKVLRYNNIPLCFLPAVLLILLFAQNTEKRGVTCCNLLFWGFITLAVLALFVFVGLQATAVAIIGRLEFAGTPKKNINDLLNKAYGFNINGTRFLEKKYQCCGILLRSGIVRNSTTCPYDLQLTAVPDCATSLQGSLLGKGPCIALYAFGFLIIISCLAIVISFCYHTFKKKRRDPNDVSQKKNEIELTDLGNSIKDDSVTTPLTDNIS
uniref:Tetraspanin n=1 Tax=Plectus sambesii TaxID=2011161 RepID=A0A914WPT5_9BILA